MKLDLSGIILAVAFGTLMAVGLYQAQIKGLLHVPNLELPKPVSEEKRTIIKEENAVISVVEETSPSVVAIGVSRNVINPLDPFALPTRSDSTIGTGFVVSLDGVIVTNRHVVADVNGRYSVVTKDGQKYEAEKIYRDPVLDLSLVKINAKLKPLNMGDSAKLKVGQTVIAIGNALGRFTNTVTTGVVSGLGRKVIAGDPFSGSAESLDNLIQTDAAINPGNSGGPLLNSVGEVIGVNVATTEGAQNIGFAVPINTVKGAVEEFVRTGTVSRPFLAIRYRFISRDVAILIKVPQGAYIQDIIAKGPAEKAGMQIGDIITKINSQSVDSENKISEVIFGSSIGTRLELTVWRDKKELNLTVTLEELPAQ